MEPIDAEPGDPDPESTFESLSAEECQRRVESNEDGQLVVLDVRTEPEHRSHRIPGSTLVPIQELVQRFSELDPDRPTLVYCEHGVRSIHACLFLAGQGFDQLSNLRGGIVQWQGRLEGASIDRTGGDPTPC